VLSTIMKISLLSSRSFAARQQCCKMMYSSVILCMSHILALTKVFDNMTPHPQFYRFTTVSSRSGTCSGYS